jgi:hypothetical protein
LSRGGAPDNLSCDVCDVYSSGRGSSFIAPLVVWLLLVLCCSNGSKVVAGSPFYGVAASVTELNCKMRCSRLTFPSNLHAVKQATDLMDGTWNFGLFLLLQQINNPSTCEQSTHLDFLAALRSVEAQRLRQPPSHVSTSANP